MPYINVSTSAKIKDKKKLLDEISILVSSLTKKSKRLFGCIEMPYINVSTSKKIVDKKKLLEGISVLISSLTNKSRRFVMAKLDDNCKMYFDDDCPSCFLEIKSIGSLNLVN